MKKALFIFTVILLVSIIATGQNQDKNKGKNGKTNPKAETKPAGKGGDKGQKAGSGTAGKTITYEEAVQNFKPVITQSQNGQVNWTQQYIEAKGSAVIDNERFRIPAQARAMATRGAIVIAQRNLLEIINGVQVTSETKVQDMITTSDYVYTRVDGLIKGAQQVGDAIEKDGMIEVTMRVPMYEKNGLASAVYGELPAGKGNFNKSAQAVTDENIELPEGLVFNFKGQEIDPAMFPVVVDESGNILLDLSQYYNPQEGKFPALLQSSQDIFNALGYQKGVEVIDVAKSVDGKFVLDNKNAKKFDWEKFAKTAGKVVNVFKFILTII
jgi:hypothetical protein